MAETLDPEQQGAVGHDRGSLVLSAGAGSGKTRVLVNRFLKHLIDGVPVANLVAITFTEKAAREMRKRIREAAATRTDAGIDWPRILRNLESAAIDTIHGTCAALLRRHAAAAGLDPEFEVLEGAMAGILRDEALTESLETLLLDAGPVGEDLRELVVLHGWSRIVEALYELLDSPDVAAWQAFAAKTPVEISKNWQATAVRFLPDYAASLLDARPDIARLATLSPATAEGRDILNQVLAGVKQFRSDPFSVDADSLHEIAKVSNASAGKKLYGADQYEAVRDGYKALRGVLDTGVAALAQSPADLPAAAAAALRMIRVAWHAHAHVQKRKRAANGLDFHDLLVTTRDLLLSNDSVRTAEQERTRVLLLDELQDTDGVQMEIVRLLLGDRLASGGLFAVGDAKQSIYRFRGADVALFEALRASLPPESRRVLTKNYRSGRAIIGFVNALCRDWFPDEAALEAIPPDSGHVEFHWATVEDEKPNVGRLRQAEAGAIALRIRELIAEGTPECDIVLLFRALTNVSLYENALREAGIDYYLVGGRAFYAQQEVYDLANLLRAIDNPYDGVALVGMLRSPFCSLSDDAITALCQHRDGPWQGLLAPHDLVPKPEQANSMRVRRMLSEWAAMKDSLPIARLIQRILADSGYDASLQYEPLGDRKLANLWKLQQIAREFDERRFGLAEFAAHLGDLVSSPPREEQAATVPEEAANVVRIMSIHQAKGLEFPVVIVPDVGGHVRDGTGFAGYWQRDLGAIVTVPGDSEEDEVGYPKWPAQMARKLESVAERQESLRLLYVACTRAEKTLILSSGVEYDEGEIKLTSPWLEALASVFELPTGVGPEKEKVAVRNVRMT